LDCVAQSALVAQPHVWAGEHVAFAAGSPAQSWVVVQPHSPVVVSQWAPFDPPEHCESALQPQL
jgi:hypothetical protein